jgi:catechol 2,3-dioxygenase-like lactoylglutathione lyase family enzyme
MMRKSSRRKFMQSAAAAGAVIGTCDVNTVSAQPAGRVRGFDHVALPMRTRGNRHRLFGLFRRQQINFHRPARWQDKTFTNRAPAAVPPCGDLCFVWEGSAQSLKDLLDRAAAKIETGPVPREGGRRKTGSSVYVRDPDGNLLEFMIYP